MSKPLLRFIDYEKIIPVIGIIASFLLTIYATLHIGRVLYILTGILTFLSCSIWLRIRKNASLKGSDNSDSNYNVIGLLVLFYVLLILSLIVIYFRPSLYERPLTYFISISLMTCIIVFEILISKIKDAMILFQVILIGISLTLSQQLLFPTVLGVDPWYHQMFTQYITTEGNIMTNSFYTHFPIFHLIIAFTSLITGLNYKFAAMFSVSLLQIVCNVLCIYLLGKYILNNNKVGLLASIFVIISDQHIYMSYSSIPNSLAITYLLYILYINLKLKNQKNLVCTVLAIIFLLCLILCHTITALFAAISLLLFYTSYNIFNWIASKQKTPISLIYSLLFTVSMFSWWSFVSGTTSFLGKLIKWGFDLDIFSSTPQEVMDTILNKTPLLELVFNNIGMFLFFSISFIGFFYMISKKYGNHYTFSLAILGITPLFLAFSSMITQHSIIEHRWWYFAQIFLSIPLSISTILLYNKIGTISGKYTHIPHLILATFIIFFSFILIMSPMANIDNHTFSPNSSQRSALTESEMCAISTISKKCDQTICVDQFLTLINFLPIDLSVVPINEELYTGDFRRLNYKFILIRDDIIYNSVKIYANVLKLDYDPTKKLDIQGFSKIYNCNSVKLYLRTV